MMSTVLRSANPGSTAASLWHHAPILALNSQPTTVELCIGFRASTCHELQRPLRGYLQQLLMEVGKALPSSESADWLLQACQEPQS